MQYVVKSGDTLYLIARQFGTTVSAILAVNPQITNPALIYPGQIITIPAAAPIPPENTKYIVKPGDTLWAIARRFGISLEALLAANPQIVNPNQIQVGQEINIPVSFGPVVVPKVKYGYDEMVDDIFRLKARYPFLQIESAGKSVEGRELYLIRLGTGAREYFYHGAIHANEWITVPLLTKFVEDYARSYQQGSPLLGYDIRALFSQAAVWVMPLANPDGVELVLEGISPTSPYYNLVLTANGGSADFSRWKANIRGVDLNDQFPAFWETEAARGPRQPSYRDYAGPYAFSEPESKAMGSFTQAHDLRLVIAMHTQGQVIYWGYRGFEPPVSSVIADNMARVSGYVPIRYIDSDAGYRDWFIQDFRRPGFTVEAGKGVNPLPVSQFPGIYAQVLPILLYGTTAY